MAQVAVKRRLVNPARRRNNPRKKLSLAQRLAGFGGKRSQAAAKAAKKRSRAATKAAATRKRTSAAPRRVTKATTRKTATTRKKRTARPRRSNPTEIIQLGLANPAPKRRKTVRRKRKASTSRRRPSYRRRRSNPVARTRRARRSNPTSVARRPYRRRNPAVTRRRRRNPSSVGRVGGMLQQSLYLISGAVGTRAVTQMVLKGKNEGAIGYVGNAVAAFALGGVAGKVLKSKAVGQTVTFGGIVALALRLIQDFTPLGGYVQQTLAMSGIRGDVGVGFLEPTTFFVPLAPADGRGARNAQMAVPQVAAPQPANGQAMNGLSGHTVNGRYGGGRYS